MKASFEKTALGLLLFALAALALVAPAAGAATAMTELVSVASDGTLGTSDSGGTYWTPPKVSADGRFVVFESRASNLMPLDGNSTGLGTDVFVHDRQSGRTEPISVSSDGTPGNETSRNAAISADGRFVAFASYASNLVPGDTNSLADVFVHDRQSGITERVSVGSEGAQGDRESDYPSLSADGRLVFFHSSATNLIPGDTNNMDVFVRDRQAGTTERAVRNGRMPAVSADGRFVAFISHNASQVAGDTNGAVDVFVRDRLIGHTERVSVSSEGVQADRESSHYPTISADGRYVVFDSRASNLVPGDTNGIADVFVRDRQNATTELVSVGVDGAPANYSASWGGWTGVSADGRFVAFASGSSNLVRGDTGGGHLDVFVRDRQTGSTERVSVTSDGAQANSTSGGPAISADGRVVVFQSRASNLVAGDTNRAEDVFAYDRSLSAREAAAPKAPPWFPFHGPFPVDVASVSNAVHWPAVDSPDICLYELERSIDGGPFVLVDGSTSPRATAREHTVGHSYQYRVRAVNCRGDTSSYKTARAFTPAAADGGADDVSYTGSWSELTETFTSFGGTLHHSVTAGDSVSYSARARRIAWIAPRGPDRGSAKVYVDGVEVATVNLHRTYRLLRRVVWQQAWSTTAEHTVRIEVLSGRVDVDGLAVLR